MLIFRGKVKNYTINGVVYVKKFNGMSGKGTWCEWVGKEKSSVVGLWYISSVFIIKWLKNVVHGAPYT